MEPNGIGGGMFSSISTGLLGVENPFQEPNLQNQQNPHNLHHPQMVSYAAHHDTEALPQQHQSRYPFSAKANKSQTSTFSDEDEPGFTADEASGNPKRKASPWHRMKWTDAMVRLLIMAVYYIGDEGGSEGGAADSLGKKKASGLLLKKGKWKSVSRAMMEKGFYVSPQQCEDKFNDLNKRYKRVNDILGKGTACRVVENQSLLDTMDLSPKMKEEVRKLLNSKHLFFREMCAYHNSCGHGSSNSGAPNVHQSAEVGKEPSHVQPQHQQQQKCSHSTVNGVGMMKGRNVHEEEDDEDEYDDSEDYSDDDEDESAEGGSRGQVEDDENDVRSSRKRQRKGGLCVSNQMMQQLSSEVVGVLQDGGRSLWEKKQWMKKKVMQLQEQQINYHVQAFELEKQRLKWARFSSKKEREMERDKLENERKRLEIERMVLILRQKELELLKIQHLKSQQQQQHSST